MHVPAHTCHVLLTCCPLLAALWYVLRLLLGPSGKQCVRPAQCCLVEAPLCS